jgi:F-type H+-transporting ATPase subunit epsilon
MYEKAFHVEVITPGKVAYQGDATSLSAPGVQGRFQILYNHAAFLSALDVGELVIKNTEGNNTVYATSGGFLEVKNNRAVVLVESAESLNEIDVQRARAAKERAVGRLHSRDPEVDEERARTALKRATNRIRLVEKA